MRDPFLIDGPTCISFSGGRTSAYMLWRVLESNGGMPADAVVAFANTGKEMEETLEFVRDCGQQWNVPIAWLEYRSDERGFAVVDFDTASRDGEPFEALIRKRRYLPNPVARFCTDALKVTAINKFCQTINADEWQMMIGVRADEPRRIGKLRTRGLSLPLVDAGVSLADVRAFWSANGFDLALPYVGNITPLGNCDLCPMKGGKQIMSLIAKQPQRAEWWSRMEQEVGATFRSDRPSYAAMMLNAETQADWVGHDESIPCFCGE